MTHADETRRQESERFREAVDRKAHDAQLRAEQEEQSRIADDRPPDELSPRAKSTGHKKKTADKWNQ